MGMATRSSSQLNIRSSKARERALQLAAETGKTVTQIVEEAVQAYRPPPPFDEQLPSGLVRQGRFLVLASQGGAPMTLEETNEGIEAGRDRDLFGD